MRGLESVKTINTYLVLRSSMVEQALADREEQLRFEHRLMTDPEFAAEWMREQDDE